MKSPLHKILPGFDLLFERVKNIKLYRHEGSLGGVTYESEGAMLRCYTNAREGLVETSPRQLIIESWNGNCNLLVNGNYVWKPMPRLVKAFSNPIEQVGDLTYNLSLLDGEVRTAISRIKIINFSKKN